MTTTDDRSDYANFTNALVADFRAHGGKVTSGPFLGRNILLLTAKGARTGKPDFRRWPTRAMGTGS